MTAYVKKYRPKSLDEIYGQDSAVTQIRGMLKSSSNNQVIGIFGLPGQGKTSLARILACEVNKISYTDKHSDIMEFNLGSKRGIADIREIDAISQYRPSLKYRVIIADEIHALTGQALSAALKPIEDAPAETMFILCTSEPAMLPATIMRRCKKIYLKQSTPEEIVPLLKKVVKKEKIKLPNEKLLLKITKTANGQPCESLQNLEALADYLREKPKASYEECCKLLQNSASSTVINQAATDVLIGCYNGNIEKVAKAAFYLQDDPMGSLFLLLNLNSVIINSHTKNKGYWSPQVKHLESAFKNPPKLNLAIKLHYLLIQIRDTALIAGNITDGHSLVAKLSRAATAFIGE